MIAAAAAGGFVLLVGGMVAVARHAAREYDAMMAGADGAADRARFL